jgi:hypothetical protein
MCGPYHELDEEIMDVLLGRQNKRKRPESKSFKLDWRARQLTTLNSSTMI